jgi:hypothetical protein
VRWLDELIVALWHDLQAYMEWKVWDQTLREARGEAGRQAALGRAVCGGNCVEDCVCAKMQARQGWCACTHASAFTDYLHHWLQLNMNTSTLLAATTGVMLPDVHSSSVLRAET